MSVSPAIGPTAFLASIPSQAKLGAVTIGNFDGVHIGHQSLISNLICLAKKMGGPSIVVTFDPSPLRILKPEVAPAILTTSSNKSSLLKGLGVDHVVTINTTNELLNLPPVDFFQQIIVDQLRAKALLEGDNFRFGKNRVGDTELLRSLCDKSGIHFELAIPQQYEGEWISSTRVREAISQGKMTLANQWLGRNYRLSGTVGHGAHRGRTLGFPTANLDKIEELIPGHGVYAARVSGCTQATTTDTELIGRAVALHIGPNPTFSEGCAKVEAHILDFTGDLYGRQLELEIVKEVRPVQKFESIDALLHQLHHDIDFVRQTVPFAAEPLKPV